MKNSTQHMVSKFGSAILVVSTLILPSFAFAEKAYLEITLKVDPQDRAPSMPNTSKRF
jgi:hypothetical protein